MAERDLFVDVSDGDQLNEGYFNNIIQIHNSVFVQTMENTFELIVDGISVGDNYNFSYIKESSQGTGIDMTNSTCLWQGIFSANVNNRIAFCVVFDDADNGSDSAIDANKWSVATTTGGTGDANTDYKSGAIRCNATKSADGGAGYDASIISDGVSGLDLKSFSADVEVCFFLNITYSESNSGSGEATLQLSDGSNHVDIFTHTTNGSTIGFVRLVFDFDAETVDVYLNESLDQDNLDISSLVGGNWYIRAFADANASGNPGSANASILIYGIGYSEGDENPFDLVTSDDTIPVDGQGGIISINYGSVGSDSDLVHTAVSSDASNYSTNAAQKKTIMIPSANRSTTFKHRIRINESNSIDATAKNIPVIREFKGMWLG